MTLTRFHKAFDRDSTRCDEMALVTKKSPRRSAIRNVGLTITVLGIASAAPALDAHDEAAHRVPAYSHIMMIVEESKGFSQ